MVRWNIQRTKVCHFVSSIRRRLTTKKQNLGKFASKLYSLDPESQKCAKKGDLAASKAHLRGLDSIIGI